MKKCCALIILILSSTLYCRLDGQVRKKHVGIPFEKFYQNYKSQELDQWCWAACISMVFNYYGHPVSQERIVSSVYGIPANMPARAGIVIAKQLTRFWNDDEGRSFKAKLSAAYDYVNKVFFLDNRRMAKELKDGNPLIIGVGSHAVVLTAIYYDEYPNGLVDVTEAIVFDPWPGIGVRHLTKQEMYPNYPNGYHFAATVMLEDLDSDEEKVTNKDLQTVPADKPFSYFVTRCQNGFDSLKGEKEEVSQGLGSSWMSKELFPGARWTTIDLDEGVECLGASFIQESVSGAKETFDRLMQWAKDDLGEGWKGDIKKDVSARGNWWRVTYSKSTVNIGVRISWYENKTNKQRIFVRFELR